MAEVSPRLPNTMLCTLHAVPHSPGMFSILRYETARRPSQLLNTAPTAPQSCSCGSSGNSRPSTSLTFSLNFLHNAFRSVAVRSVSDVYFFDFFILAMMCSSWTRMPRPSAGSMSSAFSMTTSEYIMINRR